MKNDLKSNSFIRSVGAIDTASNSDFYTDSLDLSLGTNTAVILAISAVTDTADVSVEFSDDGVTWVASPAELNDVVTSIAVGDVVVGISAAYKRYARVHLNSSGNFIGVAIAVTNPLKHIPV